MNPYVLPDAWIRYDAIDIVEELAQAKAAVMALQAMPFQRRWADSLQQLELKREVAGTSRIEGAEFTDRELDVAMHRDESPDELRTRSQRQARAALSAYDWIRRVPLGMPIGLSTILTIHRRLVTGADDDHCEPGVLRHNGINVTFGTPRHRGCDGGDACQAAVDGLVTAFDQEFRRHDPLVQAIAAHYHIAAMHPFADGNGRTARALEALLLMRVGLRDTTFIAMSNYYHEEKTEYLSALAVVRGSGHNLTGFLRFALRGVAIQAGRLLTEIRRELKRELFRNLMHDLFSRLESPKKRVIAKRQITLMTPLLGVDEMDLAELITKVLPDYRNLKNAARAVNRDIHGLQILGMVTVSLPEAGQRPTIRAELDWPSRITETEFFERVQQVPTARAQWKPV